MARVKKRVVKKAEKLELRAVAKHEINPTRMPELNGLLTDVYGARRPKPIDYKHRRQLVHIFNAMAIELFGDSDDSPVVVGFGSFIMDMFNAESDLDLSVNFKDEKAEVPREMMIRTLRKFVKKFYYLQRGGHVGGIHIIMTARVPIVKVTDIGTGIHCDVSVENRDGIVKSQIIKIISSIDERFQKLSVLVKAWAKAHGINSSKDHSLNSLSLISFVAFHLQTRDPPILPPFSALFQEGTDPAAVVKVVKDYVNYGKSNTESVGELFITLFVKLASVENLWKKGLCVSLYEGSWIRKKWNSKIDWISVEDFIERSHNVARAVGKKNLKMIYYFIHRTLKRLLTFLDGYAKGSRLKTCLFGKDRTTQVNKHKPNLSKRNDGGAIQQVHHQSKKRLFTTMKGAKVTKGCGSANGWNRTKSLNGWTETPVGHPLAESLQSGQKKQAKLGNGWESNQQQEKGGGMQVTDGSVLKQQREGWTRPQLSKGLKQRKKGWGGPGHLRGWDSNTQKGGWEDAKLTGFWDSRKHKEERGGTKLARGWGSKQNKAEWGGPQPAGDWGLNRPKKGVGGTVIAGVWGSKQSKGGWGRTELEGWESNENECRWRGAEPAGGWESNPQENGGEETKPVRGWGSNTQKRGRGGTERAGGWGSKQHKGGWGRTEPARGWGSDQHKSGWEGAVPAGGWGSNPRKTGWGGTAPAGGWGSQPRNTGWVGTDLGGGWGSKPWEDGAEQHSEKLGMMEDARGWGSKQHSKGWERTKLVGGWESKKRKERWEEMDLAESRGVKRHKKGWGGPELAASWGLKKHTKGWGGTENAESRGPKRHTKGWGGTEVPKSWGSQHHTREWGGTKVLNGCKEAEHAEACRDTSSDKGWEGKTVWTVWETSKTTLRKDKVSRWLGIETAGEMMEETQPVQGWH